MPERITTERERTFDLFLRCSQEIDSAIGLNACASRRIDHKISPSTWASFIFSLAKISEIFLFVKDEV